jgi:hypothetical protein
MREDLRNLFWRGPGVRPCLGGSVTTHRRVCGLCGRAFAIYIPPGDHETERDKLCGECATLPKPPVVPEEQAPLKTSPLNSGNG